MIFPAWYLGNNPTKKERYRGEPLRRTGRTVWTTCAWLFSQAEHERIFGVGVSKESSAARQVEHDEGRRILRWARALASLGFVPIWVSSMILPKSQGCRLGHDQDKSGNGIKRVLEQDSKPSSSRILIQTRWHVDDLAGRLLNDEKGGGPKWHVLSIPMECDSKDDLWNGRLEIVA